MYLTRKGRLVPEAKPEPSNPRKVVVSDALVVPSHGVYQPDNGGYRRLPVATRVVKAAGRDITVPVLSKLHLPSCLALTPCQLSDAGFYGISHARDGLYFNKRHGATNAVFAKDEVGFPLGWREHLAQFDRDMRQEKEQEARKLERKSRAKAQKRFKRSLSRYTNAIATREGIPYSQAEGVAKERLVAMYSLLPAAPGWHTPTVGSVGVKGLPTAPRSFQPDKRAVEGVPVYRERPSIALGDLQTLLQADRRKRVTILQTGDKRDTTLVNDIPAFKLKWPEPVANESAVAWRKWTAGVRSLSQTQSFRDETLPVLLTPIDPLPRSESIELTPEEWSRIRESRIFGE